MLRNYIKIAFRSLLRDKTYMFINILGLSLGISTCLVIFLVLRHEMKFDQFHSQYNSIYRVVRETKNASGSENSTITPYPFASAFRNDFSQIGKVTQLHFQEESLMSNGEVKLNVEKILFADSLFFEVFDFNVLSGNPRVELGQPSKVFLTEAFVAKLGNKNIKHIKLDNKIELEVVGIIKTPPATSHIAFEMVVSYPSLTADFLGFDLNQWSLNSSGYTYLVLPDKMTAESVESQFPAFVKKYYDEEDSGRQTYLLQPLSSIHFDSVYTENPGTEAISKTLLIVLGFVGIFILVIACVNFVNLSTALSIRKSKEVGVRKTLGAQQGQLAIQYLSEAFVLTIIAALISVGATELVMPQINSFLGKNISASIIGNGEAFAFLFLVVLFTAFLSGLYPALVLSKFNPVKALKSRYADQSGASVFLRKSLVVLQFSIAQILIICTLVVSSQMNFFRDNPLGFTKEEVINVAVPENKAEILEAIRNSLAADANIQEVSFSLGAPISNNNFGTGMYLSERGNKSEQYSVRIKPVDIHYNKVYDLKLIAGRWFLESEEKLATLSNEKERKYSFVVNETAIKKLGFASAEEAIGNEIVVGINNITGPIIGVTQDFHVASLHREMTPVILMQLPGFYYDAGIKVRSSNFTTTLQSIKKIWDQQFPQYLFNYTFLDEHIGKLYREEEKMFTLFRVFAGIAIFIGCLGLYGLASFMANQKTKEVAIRKTLGASVNQLVILFSKEFVVLVLIAFVIAAPLAWVAMNKWLQGFAYHVEIGWILFVIGIAFTLVISLGTVGYRALRAAMANPVDSLKME